MKKSNTLRHAAMLLKEGKKEDARQLLVVYLKRNPKAADAWWLLSYTVKNKEQQLDCLNRAIRLEPTHNKARTRLSSLTKPPATKQIKKAPLQKKQEISGGIIAIVAIVFCLGIVGIGYFGTMIVNATSAAEELPTSMAIVSSTNTPRPPQSLPPTWTPTPSFTPPPTKTPFPSPTPSQTPPAMPTATKPPRITGVSKGNYAPDFTLINLSSGNKVSLSSYSGRPVVLVFWAIWCTYCEQELPALNNVYKKYKDQGLVILSINIGDKESKVKKYHSSHTMSYPVLLDPKKNATSLYRVSGVPVHYFINADGKIVNIGSGMINQSNLEKVVQSLIADK